MATTIVTGRDITITLAAVNYDAQTTAITLVNAPVIDTYQTLDGIAPRMLIINCSKLSNEAALE